jgi:hypothetical protein
LRREIAVRPKVGFDVRAGLAASPDGNSLLSLNLRDRVVAAVYDRQCRGVADGRQRTNSGSVVLLRLLADVHLIIPALARSAGELVTKNELINCA